MTQQIDTNKLLKHAKALATRVQHWSERELRSTYSQLWVAPKANGRLKKTMRTWIDTNRFVTRNYTKSNSIERLLAKGGAYGLTRIELYNALCLRWSKMNDSLLGSLLDYLQRRGAIVNVSRGRWVSLAVRFEGDGLEDV